MIHPQAGRASPDRPLASISAFSYLFRILYTPHFLVIDLFVPFLYYISFTLYLLLLYRFLWNRTLAQRKRGLHINADLDLVLSYVPWCLMSGLDAAGRMVIAMVCFSLSLEDSIIQGFINVCT